MTTIIHTEIRNDIKEVIDFKAIREVKKFGTGSSGHIVLPKVLIGKDVKIELIQEEKK